MPVLFTLLTLAFLIVTLIDVIRRDDGQVKYLPKVAWVIIVILIPLIGGALWWAIGREYPPHLPRPAVTGYRAPAAAPQPSDARTTEEQLAALEREIEEDRLRAEIERRRREGGEDASA